MNRRKANIVYPNGGKRLAGSYEYANIICPLFMDLYKFNGGIFVICENENELKVYNECKHLCTSFSYWKCPHYRKEVLSVKNYRIINGEPHLQYGGQSQAFKCPCYKCMYKGVYGKFILCDAVDKQAMPFGDFKEYCQSFKYLKCERYLELEKIYK